MEAIVELGHFGQRWYIASWVFQCLFQHALSRQGYSCLCLSNDIDNCIGNSEEFIGQHFPLLITQGTSFRIWHLGFVDNSVLFFNAIFFTWIQYTFFSLAIYGWIHHLTCYRLFAETITSHGIL